MPIPDGGAVLVGDFRDQTRFGAGEVEQTELFTDDPADYDAYVARIDATGALRRADGIWWRT